MTTFSWASSMTFKWASMSSFYELCNLSRKIPHAVPMHWRITNTAALAKHRPWKSCAARIWSHQGSRGPLCRYPREFNCPTICCSNSQRNPLANDEDFQKGRTGGRKPLAPLKAENKTFPKGEAPRKLHSHALTKFSSSFLRSKASHKF